MEESGSRFKDLYKTKNKDDMQEIRRRLLLKQQKQQRSLAQDEHRNVQPVIKGSKKSRKHFHTFKERYQNNYSLQFSEWLKEKPEDFNDWILVPCPKGKRCMVVTSAGAAEMYNKSGKLMKTFQSSLAGHKTDGTILDCIFVEGNSTIYVLDALIYGDLELINCDAAFRFFWLKSRLLESNFGEIGPGNDYAIKMLDSYDLEDSVKISTVLQQHPLWEDNCPELDGFLFYHKEASYTCGTCPLVGWLFAFMIPEVLEYHIHPFYLLERPSDYTDYMRYIVLFDEKMSRERKKFSRNKNSKRTPMDEDCPPQENDDDSLRELLRTEMELETLDDDQSEHI